MTARRLTSTLLLAALSGLLGSSGLAHAAPASVAPEPGPLAQTASGRLRLVAPTRGPTAAPAQPTPPTAQPRKQEPVDDAPKTLDESLVQRVAEVIDAGLSPAELQAAALEVFDSAIALHGDLELLVEHLTTLVDAEEEGTRRTAAVRLSAHLAWRYGDLNDARRHFGALAETSDDLAGRLSYARLLDANGRAKAALRAYGELVPLIEDAELKTRLRLRMALMSMESGGEEQKDALADFAREDGVSSALRNRCAIVLALLGRPGDAADLYEVPELAPEGARTDVAKKARKVAANGELRVAEWALSAEDWPRAQAAAWRAVHLATVSRERRYSLTLLAEAHRGDDSLTALLERFDAESAGLPKEARRMWIDLLRETGATSTAIEMSQGDRAQEFTRQERVRLLEMYREADREEEMVEVYHSWIAAEPAELLWRQGLSRHFLEQGDRKAAVDLWIDWFDAFASSGIPVEKPLEAAGALEALGLDELAQRAARAAIDSDENAEGAFLFLFELHLDRARLEDARAALEELDAYSQAGSAARMPLSDCLERVGELESAVRVLEGVREARGPGKAGEDLEMRLAWLYSEVGREDQALELWKELWIRVKSVARRRFVEDRLMTVAARLGVLADIAVELERKLFAGTADARDSGLLVRLYTKVGDAVSAAEIVDEFLRIQGGSELEALTEKARVYLTCNDYYHYEKAVAQLIDIDPEGRPDYFRQLAMSQLERGKPDQARATLMKLQELPGGDDTSAEFEAGVLSLSGMRDEAIAAYRRGLAAHPERIDSYLLMANLMKQVRQSDRAVGMFQYLAETADRDDMFTIAIDGLLNMLVDAAPRPKMVQWARRITLERIAGRADATYLYQLLADLSEETQDEEGQLRALENLLPAAGPRRSSVLRELMELSKPATRSFQSAGRDGDSDQQLAFGRRLVGLGELVPPEVYLDLGAAFLEAGDEGSAARTFDLTREFPDGDLYQQQAAERFEKAGFVDRSLERYQAVLAASPTNVPLLAKVGELRESLGDSPAALELYLRAYDVLLGRKTLFESGTDEEDDKPAYFARNIDDFDQYIERVLQGILSTLEDDAAVRGFLAAQRAALEVELPRALAAADADRAARAEPEDDTETESGPRLASHPRITARIGIVRRIAFAAGHASAAEDLDRWVLAAFPDDEAMVNDALDDRVRWGRFAAARELVVASGAEGERRSDLLARLGSGDSAAASGGRPIPFEQAVGAVLPTVASGDTDSLRDLVRRADVTSVEKETLGRMAVLFSAARAAGDQELALRIGRDWIRLELEGGAYPYAIESRVEAILTALDAETGLAMARYVVGRVLKDPEKNSQYVTLLPKLAQRFGDDVVDAEQVRLLLDGYGNTYAFGLGPVIALLPPADRAGALRGVWSKLEATNRAGFLLSLVNDSTEEITGELAEFILESLPAALEEADDFIKYTAGQLLDLEHSHALVLAMCKQLTVALPQLEEMAAIEVVHRHALGETGLAPEAAAAWAVLVADETNDYRKRRAREKLAEIFVEEDLDAFMAALDERVAENGESTVLTKARVELLLAADRDDAAAEILATALEAEADDEDLLALRRRVELLRGEQIAAALTLERIAEAADEAGKKRHLTSLVREWENLHAPERALVAQKKLDELGATGGSGIPGFPVGFVLAPGSMISINGVIYTSDDLNSGKKGLPKSFDEAREALASGDEDEAALIFRRLWRQFPVGQPKPRRFFSNRSYRNLALANLTWPQDEDEPGKDTEEDEEPKKGGLASYNPEKPEPAAERPDAYERIAGSPALVAEQWRFLRTVQSYELDRLQGLLEGLLGAEVAESGEEAVLRELLATAARGEGGRADQIRLLALLDRSPELVTGEAAVALSDLVRTIPPRDAVQVRRLARVLLRSGQRDLAMRLYEWCAYQGFGRSIYSGAEDIDVVTRVSDRDLVQEARDHLEGDDQLELIEIVLGVSRPVDRPWERERYEELVFDTWDDVVGPVEALRRSRALADEARDTSTGLRRRVARRVVSLYLAAGEQENALQALEVGIAKLDPELVKQPDQTWYRVDSTRPGQLSTADLRRMLPVNGGEIPNAGEWFSTFATSLSSWLEDDRVNANDAVEALALVAVRLAEVDRAEQGRELAQSLAARDDLSSRTELWVIDALRATGDEAGADERERVLLAAGRLHPERVPDVIARVLEAEGPAAARELAGAVSEYSRHPRLMTLLAEAADAAGDAEAAGAWREADAAAREAEAALKALKKPKG